MCRAFVYVFGSTVNPRIGALNLPVPPVVSARPRRQRAVTPGPGHVDAASTGAPDLLLNGDGLSRLKAGGSPSSFVRRLENKIPLVRLEYSPTVMLAVASKTACWPKTRRHRHAPHVTAYFPPVHAKRSQARLSGPQMRLSSSQDAPGRSGKGPGRYGVGGRFAPPWLCPGLCPGLCRELCPGQRKTLDRKRKGLPRVHAGVVTRQRCGLVPMPLHPVNSQARHSV